MNLRRPLAVVLVAAVPFVAGCGAGKSSETDSERATPYTASAQAGDVGVRGIRVVAGPAGGVAGYLVASIVNTGTTSDTLTNATVAGGAVTPRDASNLTIDPQHSLAFGLPSSTGSAPALEVTALSTELKPGTTVPVTFTFDQAGAVRVEVPVSSADQIGTTATAQPIATTGSYPTASPTPSTP